MNTTSEEGIWAAKRWCVVIPTFNNGHTLESVIKDVLKVTSDVIIVNDGSTDNTSEILGRFPGLKAIGYIPNKGKGYALRQGLQEARNMGFSYAITLDSDGQHFAKDIPAFIEKCKENPEALIVGTRTLKGEKLRRGSGFANKFSNFWFQLISGVSLPDTQSGYRLYPLQPLSKIRFLTRKYEFELEVLFRSAWRGIPLLNIPIDVFYPEKEDRVSHFRPLRDFMRISLLNLVCFFVAFFYVKPFSFARYLTRENMKAFLRKNILQTTDSDSKLTLSVMLGIFMGIVPIWGYQLITAIALAYILKLNKLIVILAANISIPPMIPFIIYLSYITGGFVVSGEYNMEFNSGITFAWVRDNLFQYIIGAMVFAAIAALIFGLLTLIFLKVLRKKPVFLN